MSDILARAMDKVGDRFDAVRADERTACARLIKELAAQKPWTDQQWARCALMIAARAIERGRLLTDREKLNNLADAMEADDVDPEMREVAAKIRASAGLED